MSENKFFKKKSKIYRDKRKKLIKPFILIICEGKRTEKIYFDSFRLSTSFVEIVIKGTGRSTSSLVEKAISLKKKIEKEKKIRINQVWCVFDRDNNNDFNEAIEFAKKNKINVAYSNQAFEIWYILHFVFSTSPMNVKELIYKIKKLIKENCGKEYEKNCELIFDILESKKSEAIKNAEKLLKFHDSVNGINPDQNNPSTTVHYLVKILDKYINN